MHLVTNHTSRYQNPTAGFKAEDGKLYEPDKLEDGSYAIGEDGEPYDYNGDGKVEKLIGSLNTLDFFLGGRGRFLGLNSYSWTTSILKWTHST